MEARAILSRLIQRFRPKPQTHSPGGFPLQENAFWYTGEWYTHRSDEQEAGRPWKSEETPWPVEGKLCFNPYLCLPNDTSGLINGLIPAMRLGDRIGLYRAENPRPSGPNSDLAGWDDGMLVDLVFVRSCPVSIIEGLRKIASDEAQYATP